MTDRYRGLNVGVKSSSGFEAVEAVEVLSSLGGFCEDQQHRNVAPCQLS